MTNILLHACVARGVRRNELETLWVEIKAEDRLIGQARERAVLP